MHGIEKLLNDNIRYTVRYTVAALWRNSGGFEGAVGAQTGSFDY